MPLPRSAGGTIEDADLAPRPRSELVMVVVLLVATFMVQFDFFVVSVAAPSLQQHLGIGDAGLELVVGGYAFAFAAGLVIGGRLGDLYGHRRMYLLGMAGFAVGSLLSGSAQSGPQLITARLAQGVAAAMMLPQVLGLFTAALPPTRRPGATAWYGAASGLGGIVGQVLGGALVASDVAGLGWRAIFVVNVPIGLIGVLVARRVLPEPRPIARSTLDVPGAVGVAASLALLLVPLTVGRSAGWAPWTWLLMVLAVVGGALTLMWERRLGRTGRLAPILELSLVRISTFRAGLAANFTFSLYFASYMFTLSLFCQTAMRLGPLQTGLLFTPAALLFLVTAVLFQRLMARWGSRLIVMGALSTTASLVAMALCVAVEGAHISVLTLTVLAAGMGPGNGVVVPSLVGEGMRDVPGRYAAAGAGTLQTVRQFAASAGVAVIGTVYFAISGTPGTAAGQARGMAWATSINACLVLLVAALIAVSARRQARK